LNAPILFTKRFNYQGLHIYDTFYQWRPGGGLYVLENPAEPQAQQRIRAIIDATTTNTLGAGMYFDPSLLCTSNLTVQAGGAITLRMGSSNDTV
jgi:hypothetical protein